MYSQLSVFDKGWGPALQTFLLPFSSVVLAITSWTDRSSSLESSRRRQCLPRWIVAAGQVHSGTEDPRRTLKLHVSQGRCLCRLFPIRTDTLLLRTYSRYRIAMNWASM
ncbi:uncharacterized protein CLUP02_02253 [Colletotrichum lupini]|uniref:Uncharacterized protein n=1 Tax=Colletotrichum lupini TaxID=145971 RepID=A0A9Q8SDX2_9PEZI|nr:uncharacterized protein CLUP02_02253 [Colletotrichum lupini]KAK1707996.1 hypothetical protein BDP67DRAFT_147209 [Colletotrichum lupini]UQC75597.1 hypothetical protein CLUP02_02253 [Colletotrichum lupini]